MTDEISIQNPQEKRGNYAVPGLLTGVVVGGVGGATAANYKNWGITQKPDLDRVFQQEPDSFDKQIKRVDGDNKTFLEAAKEEVQRIKDAGTEFDKIEAEVKKSGKPSISELPDGDIKTNLENAKKAYDNEFNRLLTEEQNKAKNVFTTANYDIKEPKFADSGVFSSAEILKEGTADNYLNRYRARNEYDKLTKEVSSASANIRTALSVSGQPLYAKNSALSLSSGSSINSIKDLFEAFNNEFVKAPDADKPSLFNKTKINMGAEVTTNAYNNAYNLATKLYADPVKITNPSSQFEHYLKFGEFVEGAKPVTPIGGQVLRMSYVDSTGHHTGWIKYTDAAKAQYEKDLVQQVESKRVNLAEKFLTRASNYATLKQQGQKTELIDAIKAQFNGREYLDGLGNTSATERLCSSTNWIEVEKIVNESNVNKFKKSIGGIELTGYEYDIEVLQNSSKSMPKSLNGSYFDAAGNPIKDPKVALEMAEKRLQIANAYKDLRTNITRQLEECITDNDYIKELDEKIIQAFNEDKALTEARAKLAERFPRIFTETEQAATTDVKAQVEAMMAKTDLATALKDAETKANEELAKLGKSTGELTGDDLAKAIKEKCGAATKEEYTNAVKEKAAERLKGLAEKTKFASKGWTTVAAAAALGIIGGLIGMTAKKDA